MKLTKTMNKVLKERGKEMTTKKVKQYKPSLTLKRATLVQMLQHMHLRIVFIKADGETRELYATLRKEALPPPKEGKEPSTKEKSKEVIPVWDLQKKVWRAFRLDSVVEVEVMFKNIE